VNVPHKSGNVYVYDCPRNVALDYDLPPTHYTGSPSSTIGTSLSGQADNQTDYDVPAMADASTGRAGIHSSMFGALYDSPPSLLHSSQTWYDVPTCVGVDVDQASPSNRSSVLSVTSNDSRSSIASLRSGSSPSTSARSSAEVSFRDVYDIPRAAGDVGKINAAAEAAGRIGGSKLLSGLSAADRDSFLEDYSVPRNSAAPLVASILNTSVSENSAKGASNAAPKVMPSKEMQDFYDIPRNRQTEEGCDYDVPTQSHSSKHASAGVSQQLNESVSQPDVFHRQIVAKHDAILRSIERLSDLAKKEIRGDVKHWCSLVTTTGLSLRTSLKELLDLGRLREDPGDSVVAGRLSQQCEPLSAIYASVSQCLETLLAMSPKAGEARYFGTEELSDLTELVNRLHPLVNELCVFLHSNAIDICRLSADTKVSAALPSPVVGRRQAPVVKPKPNVNRRTVSTDVQQRPLPLPPGSKGASTKPAGGNWTYDDYDYISISREVESISGETVAVQNLQRSASTHPPPADPSKRCAVINGVADQPVVLNASDRDLLLYYAAQVHSHTSAVESTVCEFCQSVTSEVVMPEVFVQMSKRVVVAGHKLVYIGDTLARHITDSGVCNRVATAANVLCDCLKSVVVSTKEAVLSVLGSDTLNRRAIDSAKSALAACKQLCDVIESTATQL